MKRFILISALLAFVGNSDAYEFSTHAEMTKRAWNRMIGLDENKTLLVTLGIIKPTAPIFSGTRYFDISGSIIRERSIQTWDRHQMEDRGVPFATLPGWIVRGAILVGDGGGVTAPMYEWYGRGKYGVACLASGQCSAATWAAATCTAPIAAQPVPVVVNFPQQ